MLTCNNKHRRVLFSTPKRGQSSTPVFIYLLTYIISFLVTTEMTYYLSARLDYQLSPSVSNVVYLWTINITN